MLTTQTKGIIAIFAISALALFLLLPKKKGVAEPDVAEASKVTDLQNARIALDAYCNAVDAGESSRFLVKLNNQLAQEYGITVVKNKDKKYVAKTLDGRQILMVK